jgi:adhesin transport system outer membrane protein
MRSGYRLILVSLLACSGLGLVSCNQASRKDDLRQPSPVSPTIATSPAAPSSGNSNSHRPVSSIDAAVKRAVAWHPAVLQAASRINEQTEAIADARSGYLPSVGGGVNLGLDSGDSDDKGPRFNLTASQMIYDFGKVSGRVETETALHDVRQAQFLATVDEIIKGTVHAAVEILRNESLEKVAQEQIQDVQAIGELVDARTERGASTRSDKLQAEARVQAAQSTALEITGQKQRWQMSLTALLGGPAEIGAGARLPKTLTNTCAGAAPDFETSPAVVAARHHQREADARVGLVTAETLPTVALEASSQLGILNDSDPDYVIGFTIKGDLYNGGSFRAKRNAAQYAAQTSAAAVGAARYDVQRSWSEAAAQVASLSALQKSLASRETMMRETRDLYQKQFIDLGTRTLLDVLNADQELHAARFDEINTRYDLYKLSVQCAFAAGTLRRIFGLEAETRGSTKPTPDFASDRSGLGRRT